MKAHLPEDSWYRDFFDLVADAELAERLAEEFKAARSVYKLFRGLEAADWLQRAQVRIQVLQYASIYEAVIHHVLFDRFGDDDRVRRLLEFPKLKRISIPTAMHAKVAAALQHDGKEIIPTYQSTERQDVTKVRFDQKVACAVELNLIDADLANDLTALYEARNAIHIHAELRKGLKYDLDLARQAYRRMEPFRAQLVTSLRRHGKLLPGAGMTVEFDAEAV